MDKASGTIGMEARWQCDRCASLLLGRHGTPMRLEFAQRNLRTRRLNGSLSADVTYCVCNECGMEWLWESASLYERSEGVGVT